MPSNKPGTVHPFNDKDQGNNIIDLEGGREEENELKDRNKVRKPPSNGKSQDNDDDDDDDDDYFKPDYFPTWREYLQYRWKNSNIWKYSYGEHLKLEQANDVVNALSLVNALILTIPFGVIMGLGKDYWDWLESSIQDCTVYDSQQTYRNILNNLYGAAYAPMICLLMSLLYYFLRPSGKYFKDWWQRGKWTVLFMIFLTFAAISCMLSVFSNIAGYYALPSDGFCGKYHGNEHRYGLSLGFLGFFLIFCFLLMF